MDGSAKFRTDQWDREDGGSGITRIISNGAIFEKAGVNFSHVFGKSMPASATADRPELAGQAFQAMGVSWWYTQNPMCPPHMLTSDYLLLRGGSRFRLVVWRRLRFDSLLRL